jgi:hypothetical protein
MAFVTNLFSGRRWFDLVPDSMHKLVVSGYGTYSDAGDVNANDYVTAARARDAKLAIAYLPTGRTIVVTWRGCPDVSMRGGTTLRAEDMRPSPGNRSRAPAGEASRRPAGIATATRTGCWC